MEKISRAERHPAGLEGAGFGFVRYFLLLILLSTALLAGICAALSWYLGMDLSVEGAGKIEARRRCLVKSEVGGIVREIAVRQGQRVRAGQRLAALDAAQWRAQWRKLEKDLEENRSRRVGLGRRMEQERRIRRAEQERARLEVEEAGLALEQVRAEQRLYAEAPFLPPGLRRRPLEELLPVRRARAALARRRAAWRAAQQRLAAVEGGQQEIGTLERQYEKLLQDRALLGERLRHAVIRAPVDGTVLTGALERRVGDRLQSGELLMELAQLGAWQARVTVREEDVPRVKTGQSARLYVRAFPHMEYKIFSGRVEEVAVRPAPGEEGYSVEVSIADPQVENAGRVYSLSHGMSAEVRIVVERGRILELVWRWLLRQVGKAAKSDLHRAGSGAL